MLGCSRLSGVVGDLASGFHRLCHIHFFHDNPLNALFSGVGISGANATSLTLANDSYDYVLTGTGLTFTEEDGVVTELTGGSFTMLTIKQADGGAVVARLTGVIMQVVALPDLDDPVSG